MNIVFDISKIELSNIMFLDTKKNMIMDGSFTKVLYSDVYMSTNGIYVNIPFEFSGTNNIRNKIALHFTMMNYVNAELFSNICNLEHDIIDTYITRNQLNKIPVYSMKEYLKYGCIKIFQESGDHTINYLSPENMCIAKISGIWETTSSVGITYKIVRFFKTVI